MVQILCTGLMNIIFFLCWHIYYCNRKLVLDIFKAFKCPFYYKCNIIYYKCECTNVSCISSKDLLLMFRSTLTPANVIFLKCNNY